VLYRVNERDSYGLGEFMLCSACYIRLRLIWLHVFKLDDSFTDNMSLTHELPVFCFQCPRNLSHDNRRKKIQRCRFIRRRLSVLCFVCVGFPLYSETHSTKHSWNPRFICRWKRYWPDLVFLRFLLHMRSGMNLLIMCFRQCVAFLLGLRYNCSKKCVNFI
jgi:hypothetical protein